MFAYLIRRALYAIPILIGVNLLTFVLFFVVNSPDDVARMQIGVKRATPEAIERWKLERGYDKPMFINTEATGSARFSETIFFDKSLRMFALDFGRADDGRDIGQEIRDRMGPSLAIALPTFILSLGVSISFALLLVFFRATYLDFWGVVLCVAMMSISSLFYIIGGQWLVSKLWALVPISGYASGLDAGRFLILPVMISVLAGIGSSARWYRTIFLEEISKDYVRTARAKGLSELAVLFRHVLRNALIPILTNVSMQLPGIFVGSFLIEVFFSIPGIGREVMLAVNRSDYPVIQAVTIYLAVITMLINLLTDLLYKAVDPRVTLK